MRPTTTATAVLSSIVVVLASLTVLGVAPAVAVSASGDDNLGQHHHPYDPHHDDPHHDDQFNHPHHQYNQDNQDNHDDGVDGDDRGDTTANNDTPNNDDDAEDPYASLDATTLEPRRRALLAEDLLNQVQPIFPFAVSFCRSADGQDGVDHQVEVDQADQADHEEDQDHDGEPRANRRRGGPPLVMDSEQSIRLEAMRLLGKREIFPTSQLDIKAFYDLGQKFCTNEDYPFGNLRLALWGLLEYNDYEVLKLFQQQQRDDPDHSDHSDYQTSFGDRSVLPHAYAYYRWVKPMDFLTTPPRPSKTFPLLMYSFLTLGQRSVPFHVPRTRQNIEAIVSQAVSVKHGLLTPLLSLALGRAILEQNRAFASAAMPITPYSAFSQIRRKSKEADADYYTARKQMAKVIFHLKAMLDDKASRRRRRPRGGGSASGSARGDDQDHADTDTADTDDSDLPRLEKEALKDVAFLAYVEYKSLVTNAYGTLLMANMRVKWYDVFHHLPESKFSLQHSRFMKTMSFYGRLFVRAGLAAIHAAPHQYPPSIVHDHGRRQEWTRLIGVSGKRQRALLRQRERERSSPAAATTPATTPTPTPPNDDRTTLLNDLVCLPGPSKYWRPWYLLWNGMAKLHQSPWLPLQWSEKERKRFGVDEMPGIFTSETATEAFAPPHHALLLHLNNNPNSNQHGATAAPPPPHNHQHQHPRHQPFDNMEFCTDVVRGGAAATAGAGGTDRQFGDGDNNDNNNDNDTENGSEAHSERSVAREGSRANSHTSARSQRL